MNAMNRSPRLIFTAAFTATLLAPLACGSPEKPAQNPENAAIGEPGNAAGSATGTSMKSADFDADRAPAFSLASHDGSVHSLEAMVERGPTVLVFYRGHW